MIKKIIWSVILLGVISFEVYDNLKSNSVYYAKNMPHSEESEPELAMLLDNLWWIYTPEIEGVEYDKKSINIISKDKGKIILNSTYEDSTGYKYIYIRYEMNFIFNNEFKLISAGNGFGEKSRINLFTIDEKKVKQEIHELAKPVIDAQGEPLINLQWLFNYLYKDDFSIS